MEYQEVNTSMDSDVCLENDVPQNDTFNACPFEDDYV